jgi:hypothetical protein
MVLTLSSQPTSGVQERSIVPACLQQRAPLGYELRDESERRLSPTLVGYKLRRGKTYQLRVRTQDKVSKNWKLRLLAPRRVVEPDVDEVDGDARIITFHTVPAAPGEPWNLFQSQVTSLPVHLEFQDGRDPYRFSIPVILRASRFRWILYFLLTALLSVLSQAIFRDGLTLPSTSQLVIAGGVWLLLMLALVAWDQWRFYRQAQRLLAGTLQQARPLHSDPPPH